MRLPNAGKAFVEEPKLGYLLRAEKKGDFFQAIGFSTWEPESLRDALLGHARRQEVSRTLKTPFGVKYVLDGLLKSSDERDPETWSVWIVETGRDRSRFLTAYSPVKEVSMIGEFDRIALTRYLPEDSLVAGDAGTVIHVYEGGKGYEVEFFALSGRTLAVATVMAEDVRLVGDEDVTHARTRERSEA